MKKEKPVVITRKNFDKIKQIFEDAVWRVWKLTTLIVPKMYLDFRVNFQEIYASTIGRIFAFTPFWRGKAFTDVILMHEFLHWAIYPIDIYRGLKDISRARILLAEEMKFKPSIKKDTILGEREDWSNFSHPIQEFAFVQNLLGDYLINLHIHDNHPILFKDLWKFLYQDGSFYEEQKKIKRDKTFLLYLSAYPELLPQLPEVVFIDPQNETKRDKIVTIIREVRDGKMSKVFAIKELVKIFHDSLKEDQKDSEEKGKGKQQDPKCPSCGKNDFEIVEYEDPKTGKWTHV